LWAANDPSIDPARVHACSYERIECVSLSPAFATARARKLQTPALTAVMLDIVYVARLDHSD